MMGYATQKERKLKSEYAAFKANIYKKTGAKLFIESSEIQANEIARLSMKYVYSVGSHKLINPPILGQISERVKDEIDKTRKYPMKRIKAFLKLFK
jgi:hypothetical protein